MMKKLLLFLFIIQQLYVAHCADFKCYSCKGDCAAKTEIDCAEKCCYSSAAAVGNATAAPAAAAPAAAPPAAAPARKRRFLSTGSPFDDDERIAAYLDDTHKFKGCCAATTKEDCKKSPGCYTCMDSLCNAGDSGAFKLMAAGPAMAMLAAFFSVAFSSPYF